MRYLPYVIACVIVAALLSLGVYALRTAYKAGYSAHQVLSDAERAATLRANENVAQRASETLSYNLGKAATLDARAEQILLEIESYEIAPSEQPLPDAPAVSCGVDIERLRLLDEIK